jgi:hypothetical protein
MSGKASRRLRSAGEMSDQRDHEQNQEDVENDLRNTRSSQSYTAKTKHSSKQRDHEKSNSPP